MPRPPKCRQVEFVPHLTFFKPAGVPLRELEEVCITVEELEAVRLKDLEGLEQEPCAEKMGVSRPTFHRIVTAARAKIAQALVEGKAIRVEGGNYRVVMRKIACPSCKHEWESPFQHGRCKSKVIVECPKCAAKFSGKQGAGKCD
ncbi:DUF134 domain-containing protein [Desulfolucanica intricata]|uniref:DUF134 domain-containing protein n=1 Tax=Desulfolucanica intricata TaxID=1285191 RepID=UPI000833F140|nr:DUF134 domain-containing protein [Desulfolucanica intricata]